MDEKFCVIPCNGLDKSLGVMTGALAIKLCEKSPQIDLICPVLYNTGSEKYNQAVVTDQIIVIDGCMTRCASKLMEITEKKPVIKLFIPDLLKKYGVSLPKGLLLESKTYDIIDKIASEILASLPAQAIKEHAQQQRILSDLKNEYMEFVVDKFKFTVPKTGYLFNENDCWVRSEGDFAYIGISDYVQNQVGDVLFIELLEIGSIIDQFGEAGDIESSKTIIQLISPVSGEIIEVNTALSTEPEILNKDPYVYGWIAKVKIADFAEEKELLMDSSQYFEYMKKKVIKESQK